VGGSRYQHSAIEAPVSPLCLRVGTIRKRASESGATESGMRYARRRITESVLCDKSISRVLLFGTRKSPVSDASVITYLEVKSPI